MYYVGHYVRGFTREILELDATSPEDAVDGAEEMFEGYFLDLDEDEGVEAGRRQRLRFVEELRQTGFVTLSDGSENLLYLSISKQRIEEAERLMYKGAAFGRPLSF